MPPFLDGREKAPVVVEWVGEGEGWIGPGTPRWMSAEMRSM